MMFRIGIISDTHGLLRPEAERGLMGVDHIIHAGDIGRPEIVDALRRIAPVTAIRGNVDSGEWARQYPDTKLVRLAGKSIYVLHDLSAAGRSLRRHRRHRLRAYPRAEDRHGRWRSLPESRQRGTAALQAADHACDTRRHA
jgi:putative phosphoesterase